MLVWLIVPFMIFAVFDPSHLTVCINCSFVTYIIIMAALHSRCGHYIFALWFLLCIYLFSSPNLSGRRVDVYHTPIHGVTLVRI